MNTLKKSLIYFAPTEESYYRFQFPDFFTPTTISWGGNNRTVAIRLPSKAKNNLYLEHRVSSNTADISEVISAILLGIGYGIKNQIFPKTPKIFGNGFDEQYKLEKIPKTIQEAKLYSPIDQCIDYRTFMQIINN